MSNLMTSLPPDYFKMRSNIVYHHRRYQYFKGKNLDVIYPGVITPAKKAIAYEWNDVMDQFNEGNNNVSANGLKKEKDRILKKLDKKITDMEFVEGKIAVQTGSIIDPNDYVKMSPAKKVKFWTNYFALIEMDFTSGEETPIQCFIKLLSLIEIDKQLWKKTARKLSFFSRKWTKETTHEKSSRRIKNSLIENFTGFTNSIVTGVNTALQQNKLSFPNVEEYLTEAFGEIKKKKRASAETIRNNIKESIRHIFDYAYEQAYKNKKYENLNISVNINGNDDVFLYEIKVNEGSNNNIELNTDKERSKAIQNFFNAVEKTIRGLQINNIYNTINGKKFILTEDTKKKALDYLSKNNKNLQENLSLAMVENDSVMTGNIGELLVYLNLSQYSGHIVTNIRHIGASNKFADILANFRVSGDTTNFTDFKFREYGLNIKRFVAKVGSNKFEVYKEQNINNNNYKNYFSKDEIKLINYIKRNYSFSREVMPKLTDIDFMNFTPKEMDAMWKHMLFEHLTDFARITDSTEMTIDAYGQIEGQKENLFFVINNYYFPISLIYTQIRKTIYKNGNAYFSNIVSITDGEKIAHQPRSNYNNLKITSGKRAYFTAKFEGLIIDAKNLI